MKVFVAGGSGAIGRRLVPQLLAAGHDVVATTRSSERARALELAGAEAVVLDGLDRSAVMAAVIRAEPDVVVHQMTELAGATSLRYFDRVFARTNELRTKGTDHLLEAARAAGARRFVAQSYTGWPNARTGTTIKAEADPLDPEPPASMRETLAAIRYLEEAVTQAPGLEGLALRYGSLYGPGASDELVELVRARRLPLVGSGAGIWSFVHVDDAGSAAVAAVERGAPGVYNVVDDEPAPVAEWLRYLARTIGAKPPRRVPVWLARRLAGEAVVSMMTEIRGSSNAKARRDLRWRPRWTSWRHGFREALTDAAPAGLPTPPQRLGEVA